MKNWKTIAAVVLVFLLGMAAGGLLTAKLIQRRARQWVAGPPPGAASELVVNRLTRQLRLDATQREQIREIVRDSQQEMRALYRQVRPQAQEILGRSENHIRDILRPEQRETYDRLVAERRARWGL